MKLLSLLVTTSIAFLLVSCGGKSESGQKPPDKPDTPREPVVKVTNLKFDSTEMSVVDTAVGPQGELYALELGKLSLTTDGEIWENIPLPANHFEKSIRAVAVNDAGVIFLGSTGNGGGLFVTKDRGINYTFTEVQTTSSDPYAGVIRGLLVGEDGDVYGYNQSFLLYSNDSGNTMVAKKWAVSRPFNSDVYLYEFDGVLYTNVKNNGSGFIAVSKDKGGTFSVIPSPNTNSSMAQFADGSIVAFDKIGNVSVSPQEKFAFSKTKKSFDSWGISSATGISGEVYALSNKSLLVSKDSGETFELVMTEKLEISSNDSLQILAIAGCGRIFAFSQERAFYSGCQDSQSPTSE